MSDWFTSIANQAIQFADNLADSLVSQAAEAQLQIESEQNKLKEEEEIKSYKLSSFSSLPWESDDEALAILSQELMEQILNLSVSEENFIHTSINAKEVYFNFKDFVPTAMNLLKIDTNLARIHSKLSPKMDEEIFWFNYYCRVVYLRELIGMDGPVAKANAEKYPMADICFIHAPPAKKVVVVEDTGVFEDSESLTEKINVAETKLSNSKMSEEEQALVAEVHAALRQDLRAEGGEDGQGVLLGALGGLEEEEEDDSLDLGDLDDLLDLGDLDDGDEEADAPEQDGSAASASIANGSDGFEKVRRSDCDEPVDEDDELEAQIERELAGKH